MVDINFLSASARLQNKVKFGRIGVLMGGPSSEREISLKSGKAVCAALEEAGLEIEAVDILTDDIGENRELIKARKINCAFIALHGRFGEDGVIQGILDELSIPYTGSGRRASALAMDKAASREIFQSHGLNVPRYQVCENSPRDNSRGAAILDLNFPLVAKPASHGSSVGLSIIDRKEDLARAMEAAFSFDRTVIIEEFIKGREMTVGILDEQPLPVVEIIPKKRFFDYEAKYQPGMSEYIVPAQIDRNIAVRLQQAGLTAHKLLGCLGCSRVDIILDSRNVPFILEVNTIPGLTATSLLPKAAQAGGIEFKSLCLKLIQLAYEKKQLKN